MTGETRLPWNAKEGILFLLIISIISVNIIAPLITASELGAFNLEIWFNTLQVIPFVWISVVLLQTLIAGKLADKLVNKFVETTDGFNSRIMFNLVFNVTIMSIILTIVATMIAQGKISWNPFHTFFISWPRNFFISFWVEAVVAQPIARFAMRKLHESQMEKGIKA